jgi:N-succinyldiaminopimelate aminotransferase
MNPNLDRLQSYPFQKLAELLAGVQQNTALTPINLSIGEPKHPTPEFIRKTLAENLSGLAVYPTTLGDVGLREAIASWMKRRYNIRAIDVRNEIIPVNGSREALFAFAQAVVDTSKPQPVVVSPNPFYQIYEGAALLAGATPYFLNTVPQNGFALDLDQVPETVWQRTQLVYICSPGNPTGAVVTQTEWEELFALADRHGFIIAADECYSEIYFDEKDPPLGALQAAAILKRTGFARLVVFSSLSKRSNVPGLRSGFVAGDAEILRKFLLYRTYHGCAMSPPVHAASIAAWQDEAHVTENRRLYADKFRAVTRILAEVLPIKMPQAAFYLWVRTPIADTEFVRSLYKHYNVLVLPGSYIARAAHGINPGENYVRIALVTSLADCVDASRRIAEFVGGL